MQRRLVGGGLLCLLTAALGLGACATAGDAPATPSLAKALDRTGVAAADKEQVMKLVASLMNDVVEKR